MPPAFALLCFLCWGVAAFAVGAYSLLPFGAALHPDLRPLFEARQAWVYLHVFSAAVALILGPLQWWARLRTSRPLLHRWTGALYLGLGVGLGGCSGLVLAQQAYGGAWSQAGFSLLAVGWLLTGGFALAAILRRDVASHRRWMLRNFALALAAVSLRLWLPLALVTGFALEDAYRVIAWLSWVPHLFLVEWWLRRPVSGPVAPTRSPGLRSAIVQR
jgi:uncharacterized membrane protein